MNVLAFGFGNLGGPDLIIILLIVLVLFGAKKIPELFKGLGQGMNEFRKAREEFDREIRTATTQDPKSQPPAVQQPQQTVPTQSSPQGQASGGQENTPQKPS
jgi:sec-independent protein translocase protein TatA